MNSRAALKGGFGATLVAVFGVVLLAFVMLARLTRQWTEMSTVISSRDAILQNSMLHLGYANLYFQKHLYRPGSDADRFRAEIGILGDLLGRYGASGALTGEESQLLDHARAALERYRQDLDKVAALRAAGASQGRLEFAIQSEDDKILALLIRKLTDLNSHRAEAAAQGINVQFRDSRVGLVAAALVAAAGVLLAWVFSSRALARYDQERNQGIRDLEQEVGQRRQSERDLSRLNRELLAISSCNGVLLRTTDEQALLADICRIICNEAGYVMAWVGWREPGAVRDIRPVAWAGFEDGYLRQSTFSWADDAHGRGPAGRAIRSGRSAGIEDFASDPEAAPWREPALARGYRAMLALPLKDGAGGTFGVLCIYASEPRSFAPEEIRLLEELSGDLAFGVAVLRARIEQARAEAALRASEARNQAMIHAIPDLIFTFNRRGEYLSIHSPASGLLAGTPELVLNRTVFQVLPAGVAETFTRAIEAALAGNRVQAFDYTLELGGQEHFFEARLAPCAAGTVLAIIRDVSPAKRGERQRLELQTQLQQAQKMESLGSLAGGVAHDMNNVLGAILGLASANLGASPAGSPVHQALATIILAAERGGKMLKSLLNFARQSPAEELELDLNAVLRGEVLLLEPTTFSKIHLELDLEPDLHPIRGDQDALLHAFMNLCVNAVDAMADQGTLTLRTRNLDPGRIQVEVQDTGAGMAPDVLAKALNPFFTTKKPGKGTGLGLALVYSTVKAHHGQLDLQSGPGRGTCVRMVFPAALPAGPASRSAAGAGLDPGRALEHRSLAVLLIDDDDLVQVSSQGLLEAMGHRVTVAASGEEALARLGDGLAPDLVILDLNMPGLGGAGTLPRLRALRPRLPVLLATGRADQAALDLVRGHPGVSLLPKPFAMEELQVQLERAGV